MYYLVYSGPQYMFTKHKNNKGCEKIQLVKMTVPREDEGYSLFHAPVTSLAWNESAYISIQ